MANAKLVQPPPRVDLVEITKDQSGALHGRITRPWQLYFDDLYARAGGNNALSNEELGEMLNGSEQAPLPYPAADAESDADSLSPVALTMPQDDDIGGRLEALEVMVAALEIEIDGLKQGAAP